MNFVKNFTRNYPKKKTYFKSNSKFIFDVFVQLSTTSKPKLLAMNPQSKKKLNKRWKLPSTTQFPANILAGVTRVMNDLFKHSCLVAEDGAFDLIRHHSPHYFSRFLTLAKEFVFG